MAKKLLTESNETYFNEIIGDFIAEIDKNAILISYICK